jgi:rSAM/selenodomain-associated transferase 1
LARIISLPFSLTKRIEWPLPFMRYIILHSMLFPSPILLFVKAPIKGQVKSRLAAGLGDDAALELYKNFVLDILETIEKTGHPCTIFFHPPDARDAVAAWLGPGGDYLPQQGNDLGERMADAFATIFKKGVSRAILIGSDIPDISIDILRQAFRSLDSRDAVLGPAQDGGYYLIGYRSDTFVPDVFQGIEWGTSKVFLETKQKLEQAKRSVHLLPEWRDVDTLEDLNDLMARNAKSAFASSRTMKYIKRTRVQN